jgi:U3 small nucleolar RNA-associated protein 24
VRSQVKRQIGLNDNRLKKNQSKGEEESKKKEKGNEVVREVPQVSSALFFQYNTALVPRKWRLRPIDIGRGS